MKVKNSVMKKNDKSGYRRNKPPTVEVAKVALRKGGARTAAQTDKKKVKSNG